MQPTSLLVAQLDVQFMRNMTWQKLQPTSLPWLIALLFGATEEEMISMMLYLYTGKRQVAPRISLSLIKTLTPLSQR